MRCSRREEKRARDEFLKDTNIPRSGEEQDLSEVPGGSGRNVGTLRGVMGIKRGVAMRLSLHPMLPGGRDDIRDVVAGSGSDKVIRDLDKTSLCSHGAQAALKLEANGW